MDTNSWVKLIFRHSFNTLYSRFISISLLLNVFCDLKTYKTEIPTKIKSRKYARAARDNKLRNGNML